MGTSGLRVCGKLGWLCSVITSDGGCVPSPFLLRSLIPGGCTPEVRIAVPVVIVLDGTRIGGLLHPWVELAAELFLRRGVAGLPSHIVDLVWVFAEVVQFFGRPFGEAKLEELLYRRLITRVEDEVLGWAIATIAKYPHGVFMRLRVAGRPAVRPQVTDVEKTAGPNRAHGITGIASAHIGEPLAFDENSHANMQKLARMPGAVLAKPFLGSEPVSALVPANRPDTTPVSRTASSIMWPACSSVWLGRSAETSGRRRLGEASLPAAAAAASSLRRPDLCQTRFVGTEPSKQACHPLPEAHSREV